MDEVGLVGLARSLLYHHVRGDLWPGGFAREGTPSPAGGSYRQAAQLRHRHSPRATATRNAAQGASPCPRTAAPGERPARARLPRYRYRYSQRCATTLGQRPSCFARFHAARLAAVVRSHAFLPRGQRPSCARSLWASGPRSALPTLRSGQRPARCAALATPWARASGRAALALRSPVRGALRQRLR